jgi:hypothetical protein
MDNTFNLDKVLRDGPPLPGRELSIFIAESPGRDLLQASYDYVAAVLEEEFEETYRRFSASSTLHYELMNIVSVCKPVMAQFNFPKREETRLLRYAITAVIGDYLKEEAEDDA